MGDVREPRLELDDVGRCELKGLLALFIPAAAPSGYCWETLTGGRPDRMVPGTASGWVIAWGGFDGLVVLAMGCVWYATGPKPFVGIVGGS